MKAMILAAGFGTRLLPATLHLPKTCFPILGKPIIVHIIESLSSAGVSEIVINLHHLPEIFEKTLERYSLPDVNIHYSFEDEILGTAGGLKKVERLLKGDTFILHNGDIFTTIGLKEAVRFHEEKGSHATMIVKEKRESASEDSFIGLDNDNKIVRFPYGSSKANEGYIKRTYFTGIHILEPGVFEYIPPERFYGINDSVYPDMLADGHASYGYVSDSYWSDIGTPADYLRVNADMLGGDESLTGEGTTVADGCGIGPGAVIGRGCVINSGCRIIDSVLHDGVTVGESAVIKGSIVLEGCKIADHSEINDKIITEDI